MKSKIAQLSLGAALALGGIASAATLSTTTVSFQNGVDGYAGTFDRRIGLAANVPRNGADVDTDVTSNFIDGGRTATDRADLLIRFDSLSIPTGAVIVDASLELRTTSGAVNSNSQSNGAWNVYRLTKPFDSASTMTTDFGGTTSGVAIADGEADLVLGSFDDIAQDARGRANITRAVQSWVNGSPNLGLAVNSDRSTDGWSVHSTGAATIESRPKVNVTYTTDPNARVHEYQQGVNGYNGTTDVLLNLAEFTGGDGSKEDRSDDVLVTRLGSAVSEAFLDGDDGTDSYDTPYLVKFDGLELTGRQIAKAELTLVTGYSSSSADSGGPYTLHQLLVPFSTTSAYADFAGNAAAMQAAGQIGPVIASLTGMDDTEVITADVTSVLNNWRNGDANYGFYIAAAGTSNGWQIFTSGAADKNFAPLLRVVSVVPEPLSCALAVGALVALGALRSRRW